MKLQLKKYLKFGLDSKKICKPLMSDLVGDIYRVRSPKDTGSIIVPYDDEKNERGIKKDKKRS